MTAVMLKPGKSVTLLRSRSVAARQTSWGNGLGGYGAKRSPCQKRYSPICGRGPFHKHRPCGKSEAMTAAGGPCLISCSKYQPSTCLLWSNKPDSWVLTEASDHFTLCPFSNSPEVT